MPHTFYYRYSFHALRQLSTTTTKFCQSQTPKLLDRNPQPWHQKRGNTKVLYYMTIYTPSFPNT